MNMGEAYLIFRNIENPDIEDEAKGAAIWKVINMETLNSVTKDSMRKVIRYLMELAFELPEEAVYDNPELMERQEDKS